MQPRFLLVCSILLSTTSLCLGSSTTPLMLGGDRPEVVQVDAQTACPNGISLQGPHTTAAFASLFPVGGPLDLRGGTLLLEQDLRTASGATLHTAGVIDGNNHVLSLPTSTTEQLLPVAHCFCGVKQVALCEMPESIGSMEWQQHGEAPLLGMVGSADNGSLWVGNMEGKQFVSRQKRPLPSGGRLLSWSPAGDYGVIGVEPYEGGSSLLFFSYDRRAEGEESLGTVGAEHGVVTTASWSGAGDRVAVAFYEEGVAKVVVYHLREGALHQVASQTMPSTAKIYDMAWNESETRLAVGLGYALNKPELITYEVTDDALVQRAAASIAAHISSVSYFPAVDGVDERLVVGLAGGGGPERVRLYREHGAQLLAPVVGGQYPVAHDVYDMSWSPDGRLLGIVAHTGVEHDGVKETEVVVYERSGDTLYKRLGHPFAVPRYKISWAPAYEPTVLALDSSGGMTQLALHECMVVRDTTLQGSAAARWQVPLHVHGLVVWESVSNGTVRFDKGVQVATDASFMIRNALVAGDAPLQIKGDSLHSRVVLEGCSLPRLGVQSEVPLYCSKQVRLGGMIEGLLFGTDDATLQLVNDTTIRGMLTIEGDVMIKGQGHQLDVSSMLLVMKPGSSLTLRDVTVVGLYSDMLQLDEGATITFDSGKCVCFDEVTLEHGSLVLKQQAVVHKSVSHQVASARYDAGDAESLLAVARANTVSATNVTPVEHEVHPTIKPTVNPTVNPLPPVVMPTPIVDPVMVTPQPTTPALAGGKTISSATYTVTSDMVITPQAPLTITKNCTIYGSGRTLSCLAGASGVIRIAPGVQVCFQRTNLLGISPQSIQLGTGSSVVWGDGTSVSLGRGGELRQKWQIEGAVSLFGNGAVLRMAEGGMLCVEDDGALLLDSITVSGLSGYAISMMAPTSSLLLANADLQLFGDWVIDQGRLQVRYDSTIRGPHRVVYSSDAQSMIERHATLRFADEVYFSYQPAHRRTDGLVAVDATASLSVENATIGTSDAAWHYVQGRLLIAGELEGFGGGIVLNDPLAGTKAEVVFRQPVVHWGGSVVL